MSEPFQASRQGPLPVDSEAGPKWPATSTKKPPQLKEGEAQPAEVHEELSLSMGRSTQAAPS